MSTDRTGGIVTGFAVILAFQGLGSLMQIIWDLQIPGPVLGFFLMWAAITIGWLPIKWVEAAADFLLDHLLLLFTPVVVGVLPYLPHLRAHAWQLALAVTAGIVATVAVTGLVTQWLLARANRRHAADAQATPESRRAI